MIQMPRRSVTRFFIPMIDVLTLLFCIFLLMPFVKAAGDGAEGGAATPPVEPPPSDIQDAAKAIEQLRREIERLKQERADAVQQLVVRPLEISKDDGRLYYYAGGERLEVRNQDDALKLIEQQRRELRQKGGQDLYFLILYPRVLSGFPTEGQIRDYQRWFQGVPYGIDNPRAQN